MLARAVVDQRNFRAAEFPAQLAGPLAVGGEGVVVEKDLGGLGEELQAAAHFGHHVGHAADPEALAGEGLGPEAVDATARAAPAGIKRDVGIAQIRDLVVFDLQVPVVDLGDHGQGVQILEIGPVRVVMDAVAFPVAEAQNLFPGAPLGDFGDGIVEFPAGHEIHLGAGSQGLLGEDGHLRTHQAHLQLGILGFETADRFQVVLEGGAGGKEHRQFEIAGQVGHLGHRQVFRRGVHHPAFRDESGRVAQPGGIPKRGDLAGGLIARAGAAVKVLKRRRVE